MSPARLLVLLASLASLASLAVLVLVATPARAAPRQKANPYFHTCRYRGRHWDDCVQNVAQELQPLFDDGVPELGVRPIDPLFVEAFNVSEASGQFRVDLRLSNVTMHGLRDYQVTGVRSNLQELSLEIRLRVLELNFRANYYMDGRFLFLGLAGGGSCQYNFSDVDNKILINGHLVRRVSDDALHFRVTRLRWAMLPSRGSSHFSAAKSEAKSSMYSRATSRLLNDLGEGALQPFARAAELAFAEVLRERINRLLMKIPYRDLFPPGVYPLHLLERPMEDDEDDEYPPLSWTRPSTTASTTMTTTTSKTTTSESSSPVQDDPSDKEAAATTEKPSTPYQGEGLGGRFVTTTPVVLSATNSDLTGSKPPSGPVGGTTEAEAPVRPDDGRDEDRVTPSGGERLLAVNGDPAGTADADKTLDALRFESTSPAEPPIQQTAESAGMSEALEPAGAWTTEAPWEAGRIVGREPTARAETIGAGGDGADGAAAAGDAGGHADEPGHQLVVPPTPASSEITELPTATSRVGGDYEDSDPTARLASFDTAFTLDSDPGSPPGAGPVAEDVFIGDARPDSRSEYVVVRADALPPSSPRGPEEAVANAVEDATPTEGSAAQGQQGRQAGDITVAAAAESSTKAGNAIPADTDDTDPSSNETEDGRSIREVWSDDNVDATTTTDSTHTVTSSQPADALGGETEGADGGDALQAAAAALAAALAAADAREANATETRRGQLELQ